jgi:DNA ligase-1
VDIEEKTSNQNPEEKDAFGYVKRSASIEGLVPMGTAGTLIVKDKEGRVLRIGSGLNDELRQDLWDNKSKYLGSLVKYKYFPQGVKELPRHPVFLGFRDPDDL